MSLKSLGHRGKNVEPWTRLKMIRMNSEESEASLGGLK